MSKKNDIPYRYNEGKILSELTNYINKTYNQHYVGKNDIQTLDVWDSLGISEDVCMGTLIKYAMRFGKKNGKNKDDLLKLMHYAVLVYHYSIIKGGNEWFT